MKFIVSSDCDGPSNSTYVLTDLSSARDSLDSSSSMFVTITPPSVLAREKKLAIEKKKKEERAHYCAGENSCVIHAVHFLVALWFVLKYTLQRSMIATFSHSRSTGPHDDAGNTSKF